jgi:predicted outer membrane protein
MFKLTTAAAVGLCCAVGATAQDAPEAPERAPQPQRDLAMQAETRVLNLMRMSNQAEIRAAEIVLERTSSDTVRRFADRLLRDHRLADERLDSVAESKGIPLAPVALDGLSAGAGAEPAPPQDAEQFRSHEGDDLYRQPMGQSPSLAPRGEERQAPGRLSGDPLEHEGRAQTAGWDLPQIIEPPSAEQVRWREPGATGPDQRDQRDQAQQDQADIPRETPGQTPRQPRDPTVPEDPPPAEDRAAERPLDLDIARIKAQRMLREIDSADEDSLDSVYAAAMIKSHDDTVQNLRTGVAAVADADVRDLVETFIPILEQHGRLARHVQRQLGGAAVGAEDTRTPEGP